jgi:hypothetical protein
LCICVYLILAIKFRSRVGDDLRRQIGIVVLKNIIKHLDCEEIRLSDKCLNDDDVKDLLDALVQGKFTRVKTIQLVGHNLSDVSVERIAQALKTNSTVTHVDLVSSLPIYLLLLQSSCARTHRMTTQALLMWADGICWRRCRPTRP